MKNIPEKIFLQLGEDISEDFKDHHEVSWCVDKIYDTDLEYVSIEQVKKLTAERDQFQKEAIAAEIKVEKMKLMNTEIQSAEEDVKEFYAQWCKETKRNGGVLIGASIKELLASFASQFKQPGISEGVENIKPLRFRYRYVDWEEGQWSVWQNITTERLKNVMQDNSVDDIEIEPIPTVDEDEFWNKVGAILNGSISFSMYPKYLANLKQQFSITRK